MKDFAIEFRRSAGSSNGWPASNWQALSGNCQGPAGPEATHSACVPVDQRGNTILATSTICFAMERSPSGRNSSMLRGAENSAAKRLPRSERSLPRPLPHGIVTYPPFSRQSPRAGLWHAPLAGSHRATHSAFVNALVPLWRPTLGLGRESHSRSEPLTAVLRGQAGNRTQTGGVTGALWPVYGRPGRLPLAPLSEHLFTLRC
jgi:hypothetical protein